MPLHPQAQVLVDQLAGAGGPGLDELAPGDARAMYRALHSMVPAEAVGTIEDHAADGPAGPIPLRRYVPEATGRAGGAGALVWFHGGGWTIGDIETAEATCCALANRSGATVISVDYRLAPEHPFPAALDDAVAAVRWVVEHGPDLGIDSERVAVGGDSAGGNLAAVVAQQLRGTTPGLRFQLLVYPVTDCTLSSPSVDANGEGYFLTKATMQWFCANYLGSAPDAVDAKDPRVSPLRGATLEGLPPAMVVTAEYDPLCDEGDAYAAALSDAGVVVDHRRYQGQIHGFFTLPTVFDDARVALDAAGAALREALA